MLFSAILSKFAAMKYKRILLKLSGESLMGDKQYGIDNERVRQYAEDIKAVHDRGLEIAIVIGGGNIFRGLSAEKSGMDRAQADYMGMLATVMNALALQDAMRRAGLQPVDMRRAGTLETDVQLPQMGGWNMNEVPRIERARLTLLERKLIDRAKGLLMEQKGLSEDAAYKLLRKLAMDQNKRIGEVARDLVAYARLLKD